MSISLRKIVLGIPKLPKLVFTPVQDDQVQDLECFICKREYHTVDDPDDPTEVPENPAQMLCKHIAGSLCIAEWAQRTIEDPRCPLCNSSMAQATLNWYTRILSCITHTRLFRAMDSGPRFLISFCPRKTWWEKHTSSRAKALKRKLTVRDTLMGLVITIGAHIILINVLSCFAVFIRFTLAVLTSDMTHQPCSLSEFIALNLFFIVPFSITATAVFGIALAESH